MRGGDHLHPAADTRGGGGDLFARYELVRDEHVRAQRTDGGGKRVLLARIADDVGKRPDVQRKIPVRSADLVAFVVDEHVSDRPAAEQPREIAQDRRLAAPGRRQDENAAQPVRQTGAEDLFPAADHLVRDADIDGRHVLDGEALFVFIDEDAREADPLPGGARHKAAAQLFRHRIDGVLARPGDDLFNVRKADRERLLCRRNDARPAEIAIRSAIIDDDRPTRTQPQLIYAVEIEILQRAEQRPRQECEHERLPGLSAGLFIYTGKGVKIFRVCEKSGRAERKSLCPPPFPFGTRQIPR